MSNNNQLSEESLRLLLNAGFNEPEQTIWSAIMWIKNTFGFWIMVDCETEGGYWYPKVEVCSNPAWGTPSFRAAKYRTHEIIRTKFIKLPEEAYNITITTLLTQLGYGK